MTCLLRNSGLSGLARMSWPFLMRFTTTCLLESSCCRDFSYLLTSSSTFSTQEGTVSLVEESMMPSRNSM